MQGVDPATVVGRFIEECVNHGRVDLIDELVARDFIDHFPFDDELPDGNRCLATTIRLLRMAFHDLRFVIEDMIAEDDRVVVRFCMRGTHTGVLAGQPPTLRPVMIDGMAIYRVQDYQIVDQWCMVDIARLKQQLGLEEEILILHA